jgi:aspartate aminotransferase/aminotransferase
MADKSSRTIASRMRLMDSSGIRKVFDLARKMVNPIDLSMGLPDFDVPDEVKAAAVQAIADGHNRYTITQGIPELGEALMARHLRPDQREGREIIVTAGTAGAIFLTFQVLVEPGDEVIIPDPYFVIYKQVTKLCGGVPRFVDTYPDFHLTAARIEACLTPRSKVLILNSPSNPTGAVVAPQEMKAIADLARRAGLFVLTDEVYNSFSYDAPHTSFLPMYERAILLDGFSKSHAMSGWRVGYAIGPGEVVQEMIKLQHYSFVCAPSFAQHAALRALSVPVDHQIAAYRRKRDLVYEGLKDRFDVAKPEGAFYIFPKAPWGTGTEFVAEAIRRNLFIVPGGVFSERDTHFRICFAATEEKLKRAIEVLHSLADRR